MKILKAIIKTGYILLGNARYNWKETIKEKRDPKAPLFKYLEESDWCIGVYHKSIKGNRKTPPKAPVA